MPTLLLALVLYSGEILNMPVINDDYAFEHAQQECAAIGFSNIKYAELSFQGAGTWLTEDELLHPYPY